MDALHIACMLLRSGPYVISPVLLEFQDGPLSSPHHQPPEKPTASGPATMIGTILMLARIPDDGH